MVPMPEMATVWCVHLETGNPLDTKGTLVLDEGAVAFSGQDGRETRIHFTKVRQVKRVLGSPILVVSHDGEGGLRRTAFYFAQPPPLHAPDDVSRMKKKRQKKASVGYLGQQNVHHKPVIKEWVEQIREGVRRSNDSGHPDPA
jgi:hypothetical protein